jgi:glycogenin
VLAHSLRDARTTKKLAVMVTLDTVSAEVITQLHAVFDTVIPVPRIRNDTLANLHLTNRPDLHSAFTKINLWKQTQYQRLVYIDADVVAYRAPDELFDLPHAFAAAPDIGWPDIFNSGVMVLTPNLGDYYALLAMAERGISFDGADQGLLNMHFQHNFHRLPFTYNVTPSAHYQYVPAYRHFQSSINMVHFIGRDKPWLQGRQAHSSGSPFDYMLGRWWSVYDRYYRREVSCLPPAALATLTSEKQSPNNSTPPEIVQYFVKGEYNPRAPYVVPVGEPLPESGYSSHGQHHPPQQHRPLDHEEQRGHQQHHDASGHQHGQHHDQYNYQRRQQQHSHPQHQPSHQDSHPSQPPSQPPQSFSNSAYPAFATQESQAEARPEQVSAPPQHQDHENEPPREVRVMESSWNAQWLVHAPHPLRVFAIVSGEPG